MSDAALDPNDRKYLEEAMTDYWGERCHDFASGCPCCEAWRAFDALTCLPSPDAAGLVERLRADEEYLRSRVAVSLHTIANDIAEAASALSSERAAHEQTKRERERLALAICGGEDAPGYANSQSVETLEQVARQQQLEHLSNIDRATNLEARIAELEKELTALVELNDNHSPFGGELYQDRIDRTWDAARRALGEKTDD